MLNIVTWLWGSKYGVTDVGKLAAGVKRHLKQPYRFVVVTDRNPREMQCEAWPIPERDEELTTIKGCFARLRMFDPEWQASKAMLTGDRVVCMDLDTVVTGPLDPLFDKPDNFSILTGANASNPCPYNGSLWMFRAGYRPDVWTDFSLDAAAQVPFDSFPDDQAWFAHKMPGVVGWKVGSPSGVYAYQKPGWPKGEALPADARMVVFFGWRKPEKFKHLPWVQEHWTA